MKKYVSVVLFCLLTVPAFAQNELPIVPKPNSIKRGDGEFKLSYKTRIIATSEPTRKVASLLNDSLLKLHGFKLEVVSKPVKSDFISFDWNAGVPRPDNESYGLSISKKGISITALNERGFFYGVQSLLQLIPANFKGEVSIPAAEIRDEPRFKYRGMHLDTGRHFFPVEFVKKYIDLMAQFKFNNFHWHLTEDQGWRIEIKKYPKLTEIGSKRKETMKDKNFNPYVGDGIPVEGFYTQEQIKDVVAYAKARQINIIPEIELPGHSSAALAAYPQFGCKQTYEYKVQTTWGIFKEVFCPTEETFKFLEDVLDETIALFPDSPYIHIGGDEVLKDHWKESPFVQELKTRLNLKDEHEVQSYFIQRMEKFVNSKGKTIIGWDEILEGGLAPNAVVMSWRGEKGGIEAARQKHNVIMTPTDHCYFDYGQGDPAFEPINIGSYVSLEKVYSYEPVPKELKPEESQYVLGAQGNVWTEYMKTPGKVEYMALPRMLALAEAVWTKPEHKDFSGFFERLGHRLLLLEKHKVNFRIPEPVGLKNVILDKLDTAKVELKPSVPGAEIFYTLNGSTPSEASDKYTGPLSITPQPDDFVTLNTVTVLPGGRKGPVQSATYLRRPLKKQDVVTSREPGVRYMFFKGLYSKVREADLSSPDEADKSRSIQVGQFSAKTDRFAQPFAAIFDAYLFVPATDIYEFELESKDGAVFVIGEEAVVDLDGAHPITKGRGIIPLEAGYHKIRLKYFNTGGTPALSLSWGAKGQGLRRIWGGELWH